MALTATDRAFLRGQFPGLRKLTDAQVERWFYHHHLAGNPAYTIDESNDQ
jgi:hypothetical protein